MSDHDDLVLLKPEVAGRTKKSALLGLGLVLAGVVALFILDAMEERWLHELPWPSAIRTRDYSIEDAAAITVWSWELTPAQSVGDSKMAQLIQGDLLDMIALKKTDPDRLKRESPVVALSSSDMLDESVLPKARLVMFDRDSEIFQNVLASGRLPVAGEREVLAGPLLSERPLLIGGETYTVVGRLHPQVSGFVKTFVMARDDRLRVALDGILEVAQGSVHLEGGH
ncbi:MAG: hypothetical protein L3K26_11420, partial [Candidatus Hydrogenedentes bacterium]|nr:hypothetical protein [Candidatus Hydrogenedentota bacterium]